MQDKPQEKTKIYMPCNIRDNKCSNTRADRYQTMLQVDCVNHASLSIPKENRLHQSLLNHAAEKTRHAGTAAQYISIEIQLASNHPTR
jgi:hypothetical protein